VGRGHAAGRGKTAGRGQKGAGARSGFKQRPWYEGGQLPLARRLPKRGFTNIFRRERQVVNLKDLGRFDAGSVVDAAVLAAAGLVDRGDRPVKILAEGDIDRALTLKVAAISGSARKKVEAAGGSVELFVTEKKKLTKKTDGAKA
jgi:large subunit ribosomal protein L15